MLDARVGGREDGRLWGEVGQRRVSLEGAG